MRGLPPSRARPSLSSVCARHSKGRGGSVHSVPQRAPRGPQESGPCLALPPSRAERRGVAIPWLYADLAYRPPAHTTPPRHAPPPDRLAKGSPAPRRALPGRLASCLAALAYNLPYGIGRRGGAGRGGTTTR